MNRLRTPTAAGLAAVLLLTACPPMTTLHRATPVEKGSTEHTFAAGFYATRDDDLDDFPFFELQTREGISKNLDGGVSVSAPLLSAQVDVNWAFVNGSGFAAAIDPTLSFSLLDEGGFGHIGLPLLFDVVKTDTATLTLALKPSWVFVHGIDPDNDTGLIGTGLYIGASAGLTIRFSDGFALMPELSVARPADSSDSDDHVYTATLGFVF